MRLDVRARVGGRDHEVVLTCPEGTRWELVGPRVGSALGLGDHALWRVDGRLIEPGTVVGRPPLLRGAVLSPCDSSRRPGPLVPAADRRPARRAPRLQLAVVGGPAAGTVLPLPPGRLVIGRDPGCDLRVDDPALSRHHAVLTVTDGGVVLSDAGSTNGTVVDGEPLTEPRPLALGTTVRLGRSTLAVGRAAPPRVAEPDGRGRLVVRPGPPAAPSLDEVRLTRPRAPEPVEGRPFPWVTLLLPLAAAAVLVLVMRSPYLLALGLLGPVMVLATWLTERRSGRARGDAGRAAHEAAVATLQRRTVEALAAERARLEVRSLDPATALVAARRRGGPLWRAAGPLLRVGRGTVPSHVVVGGPDEVPDERPVLEHVPVELDLDACPVVGLAGPGAHRLAEALLGTLAATLPPGWLRLHVVSGSARLGVRWGWAGLLPQSSGSPVLAGSAQATALADGLVHDDRTVAPPGPRDLDVVLVLAADRGDAPSFVARVGAAATDRSGVVVVTACEGPDGVPAGARAWVTIDPGGDARVGLADGTLLTGVVPDLAAEGWGPALAHELAALTVVAGGAGTVPVPSRVTLAEVVSHELTDVDAVTEAWRAVRRRPAALLGIGPEGPVVLDLVDDGPHVLVGGTTGSGKSELLQCLVAGLALALPPEEISFLLVDYKGGAAFARCADLPHTTGLVTDLDPHLARRALVSLRAELTRREHLLRGVGAADLEGYALRRPPDAEPLPRLVIVVDEFRVLAQELPDFVSGLLTVATIGRSLGVHLVLATQRPAGVVTPDIRANVNARIALRVRDRADSEDVIDAPDAARLGDRLPGRALWRGGDGSLRLLQVAWGGAPASDRAGIQVQVDGVETEGGGGLGEGCRSELDLLVDTVAEAAAGHRRPPSPWLPALPDLLLPGQVPAGAMGLVDLPGRQSQEPHRVGLGAGRHLAVVGTHRTGRTTALRAVLAAALEGGGTHSLHVHVVDGGGALADVAALPHTGTRVTREDPQQVLTLLRRLADGCRQAGATRTLLLVDRWDAVTAAADPLLAAALQDALAGVLRDGPAAGLVAVVAGDRSLLTSSLATHLADRLLLRLADATDLALSGVPATARPEHQPPGRALRAHDHAEVQLRLVTAGDLATLAAAALPPEVPPLRLRRLPARVPLSELVAVAPGAFAVGGDEAVPVRLDLRSRAAAAVLGPPGSGRSRTLITLATATSRGLPDEVVVVAPGRSPLPGWAQGRGHVVLGPDDGAALRSHVARHPGCLVLVDGVDLLLDTAVDQACADLVRTAARGGGADHPTVLAAGTTAALAATYRGLAAELRRCGTGVVLQPRHGSDGELLGVTLPRLHSPPPGRGVLVDRGLVLPVQVALDEPAGAASARRQGSQGTIGG